jgi:hypothetical protein
MYESKVAFDAFRRNVGRCGFDVLASDNGPRSVW